jgi:glycosyltransferase involved in cell wall biosynthesis
MKVLLSAYSCVPGRGSEPGIGWNSVLRAAQFHSVWVLTHGEGREEIKAALARDALPNVEFVILDLPPWALFWKKGRRGHQLHYYFWQVAAYFVGRNLHRKVGFDVVHHVTFVRYSTPSFLALLPVPFIWGPVGGGESAPPAFWWSFSVRGKIFELARSLARKLGEYDPFVRTMARRAEIGLATSSETEVRMRALGCRRVSVVSAVGIAKEEISRLSSVPIDHGGPFRLISVGRLLHWKGFVLGLEAFAKIKDRCPDSEYWIVGSGPERKRLESLARELGVTTKVRFWGEIDRAQVLDKLSECDVLVHPSLHESGGWVCLEAMAAGRPVICLDLGGPGLNVTEDTGIKVKASTPDKTVADLAKGFLRLAQDPDLRVRMGKASRQRVKEHFSWAGKDEFMTKLYEDTVAGRENEHTHVPYIPEPRIEQ